MQARSYCLYCTYLPSSLGQIDDLRARLAALQQAAVKRQSMAIIAGNRMDPPSLDQG